MKLALNVLKRAKGQISVVPSEVERVQTYWETIGWLRKAAENGYVEAQYELGKLYASKDSPTDYWSAAHWFLLASGNKHVKAMFEFGILCYEGLGLSQNFAHAFQWWRQAAEEGLIEAQLRTGHCLTYALGTEQNYSEAINWYQKAAEQGSEEAKYRLLALCANGVGSFTDYVDSLLWYRKEIKGKLELGDWLYKTADEGDMLEKAWFGTMFSLHESAREVIEWLQQAVDEKDDPAARLLLAADYDDSLYFWSHEKYVEAAGLWLQQAADKGNSLACFGLGALHYNGRGVKRDRAKAQEWFAKAAERDSRYAPVQKSVHSEQAKKKKRLYRDWFGDSPILQYMEYLV